MKQGKERARRIVSPETRARYRDENSYASRLYNSWRGPGGERASDLLGESLIEC